MKKENLREKFKSSSLAGQSWHEVNVNSAATIDYFNNQVFY